MTMFCDTGTASDVTVARHWDTMRRRDSTRLTRDGDGDIISATGVVGRDDVIGEGGPVTVDSSNDGG
jgi:hypothetical protein